MCAELSHVSITRNYWIFSFLGHKIFSAWILSEKQIACFHYALKNLERTDKCITASSGFWTSPFCYYDIACVACVRGARNARERVTLVIVTLLVRDTREEPGSPVIMDSSSVSHMWPYVDHPMVSWPHVCVDHSIVWTMPRGPHMTHSTASQHHVLGRHHSQGQPCPCY